MFQTISKATWDSYQPPYGYYSFPFVGPTQGVQKADLVYTLRAVVPLKYLVAVENEAYLRFILFARVGGVGNIRVVFNHKEKEKLQYFDNFLHSSNDGAWKRGSIKTSSIEGLQ